MLSPEKKGWKGLWLRPSPTCIQMGPWRRDPCTPMLCQQHLLHCSVIRLEGPLWPRCDTVTLMRPNPTLHLNMRTSQHHLPPPTSLPKQVLAMCRLCPSSAGTSLQSTEAVLTFPSPLLLLLCSLAMRELFSAGQHPVLQWGDSQVSGDRSGLESDPGTKFSHLFPVTSEGLHGRDEAFIRAALASPSCAPGCLNIHKAKRTF